MIKRLKKIKKEQVVPCISLFLFLLIFIIILTLIDAGVAMWVLGVGTFLIGGVFKFIEGSYEAFKSWWLGLHLFVHIGLIFFEMIGVACVIAYIFSNFKIKIFNKDGKEISL